MISSAGPVRERPALRPVSLPWSRPMAEESRIVSQETIALRASMSSSTSRKLSGKRWYSHTQGAMTSAGAAVPFPGGVVAIDRLAQRDFAGSPSSRQVCDAN